MSQQSSFITAFVFLELLLCACICTQMYRLCAWRSPGLRDSLYLAGRVRVIIVSISQIKKWMLYVGSEAAPGLLGVLAYGQGCIRPSGSRGQHPGSVPPSFSPFLPLTLLKISGKNTSGILV